MDENGLKNAENGTKKEQRRDNQTRMDKMKTGENDEKKNGGKCGVLFVERGKCRLGVASKKKGLF